MFKNKTASNARRRSFGSKHSSFDQRNNLIANGLPKAGSWVLDVGSNMGETSNYLSDMGHIVLGLELMEKERQVASKNASKQSAFLQVGVSPEFIKGGLHWDAMLLLSVLHRVWSFEGEDFMRSVLTECGQKSDHIFIEGSTRHQRYVDNGQPAPGFPDLDVDASDQWHKELFMSTLGSEWSVSPVEKLACSSAEPFRLFYHLKRDKSRSE